MNVEQFEIFRTIAQVKSFTKAAKILNFTQPAISSQIKILEQHYNMPLFERYNNGVKLTEAGKKFYQYGDKILALFEQMENDIAGLSGFNKEHINLGASYTAGNYYLPNSIMTFKESHPSSYVRLNISDSQQIISELKDRYLDIGIVEGNAFYDRDLDFCKIGNSELVLITPATDKWINKESITIPEMLEEPFVSREDESILRNYINNCLKTYAVNYDDLNIIMEITNFEAIKHAVINNKGISIVPYPVVKNDLLQGTICQVPIEGLKLSWEINIICRANESLTGIKKDFLDYLTRSPWLIETGIQ
ncbi:transcriptional regulator, lysr family [hydrocarbon metagenome]|uniref:Transcriptional regulator, lysr family n=1 Tax=hydrocarbon metagenome TaxID=938273 RepID=A0A0W8E6Y8_9ZZZZ